MSKILVIRLSAFGDVAMLVPVVYSIAKTYPDKRFVVLTHKQFSFLFESLSENIETMLFDPDKHKGFSGLMKLRKAIKKEQFTHIADTHDVLRSKIIRTYLWKKVEVAHIDKGRKDKRTIIKTKDLSTSLTSTVERYKHVFEKLNVDFPLIFKNIFENKEVDYTLLGDWKPVENTNRVGIAPFAKHKGKIYPAEKMQKVIELLSKDPDIRIFLFGGSNEEKSILQQWTKMETNSIFLVNKLTRSEELLLIHSLDVMVSMDSANMHLASLVETPVVSIWGATHPSLGFYGYRQKLENAIQGNMDCRPCSVYGNKPCKRKDYACMHEILPEEVAKHVHSIIYKRVN